MDHISNLEVFERVTISLLVGGFIGLEREWNAKPAGLRTYALVCEGAALFTIVGILMSQQYAGSNVLVDPSRIPSTVAQGIGFIAGGVILARGNRVKGLTTAAGIWVTAALGLIIGAGFFAVALIGVASAIFVLVPVRWAERLLMNRRSEIVAMASNIKGGSNDPANV
jgi:putative Mg2+ transporter-C (MgtC) family protein